MLILLNYEDSGIFDELVMILNIGWVGEFENCLFCECELIMECGDNFEFCLKCDLDLNFDGDNVDGDCIGD